jgi:hypothetical protein
MSTLIIERPDLTNKHGRDEISLVFDKYDTDKSGFLDKDQMASVPIRSSTHADPSTHALGFILLQPSMLFHLLAPNRVLLGTSPAQIHADEIGVLRVH